MCTRTGRPPERLREQTGQGRRKNHNPDMYVLDDSGQTKYPHLLRSGIAIEWWLLRLSRNLMEWWLLRLSRNLMSRNLTQPHVCPATSCPATSRNLMNVLLSLLRSGFEL
jgi:hypothetical protein